MNDMTQQLIDQLQEIETIAKSLTHTFVKDLAHNDVDDDGMSNLIEGLKDIHSKSNSCVMISLKKKYTQ